MRYRIKIITFANGRKVFLPQKKRWFSWWGVTCDGSEFRYPWECQTREAALKNIDLNFAGNKKVQTIEFEYITKK